MGLIEQMSRVVKGNLERFFYWWGTLVTRHPYKDATFYWCSFLLFSLVNFAICIILCFAFSATENSNNEVGYILIATHHCSK